MKKSEFLEKKGVKKVFWPPSGKIFKKKLQAPP